MPRSADRTFILSVRVARAAGILVCAIAAFDLAALLLGAVDWIDAVVGFPMRANTALALACEGLALALLSGTTTSAALRTARILSVIGLSIGALTLIEHAAGVNLWIDELLVTDPTSAAAPGRMGILAATDITAIGVALLYLDARSPWISQTAAVCTALSAISVLVGDWYGSAAFWATDRLGRVPVLAAVEVTLVSVGVVLARPHHGIVYLLSRDTVASQLARRLMPAAIGGPLVLGWLVATGARSGWFSSPFGNTAFALICAAGFVLMTLATTSWLNRTETRARSIAEELREATTRSREQMAYLATIVDASHDAIVGLSLAGEVRSWNAGAQELYGFTAAEMIGRNIRDVVPADLRADYDALWAALARGEPVRNFHTRRSRRDGSRLDVSLTMSPIRDASGLAGVSEGARDITERKAAEAELRTSLATNREILAALREAEERTDFALVSAHIGVWELDLETQKMRSTQAMAALCQRAVEELDRSGFTEFLHPEDRAPLLELRDRAIRERRPFEYECRLLWPDGTLRSMHLTAFVAPAQEGHHARLVGVLEDITDRRSLEAQLQQAQKMEAVGQLAGGIAHDFNNLLTAILGYARLLRDDLAGPEQLRDLEQIEKAAERAAGLTRQLLAFSRRQIVEAHDLDLDGIVRDIVPMLRRLLGEQIELTMSLTLDGARIHADRGQIEQVIMNLVVNARDAMPGGGRIGIQTAILQLEAGSDMRGRPPLPGHYVMLAVSDSGQGMTPEVQRRLFEPFFTTKEAGKGTGLGLATVYGIVQQTRGHIAVESQVAQGSTFRIFFPAVQPAVAAATGQSAISSRTRSRGEVVLVVEDEDAVRRLAAVFLERAGYQVLQAPGPHEAEDIFRAANGDIDVLVTDIVMPGGTGLDLYRRLKRSHVKLRALFMSGYTGEVAIAQEQLETGAAFLQKPFAADVLVEKVREVLDR